MQGELSELDLQTVILLEFLDTPGDEVAPGSNEIGKNFKNKRFRHDGLPASLWVIAYSIWSAMRYKAAYCHKPHAICHMP
jgi:hypothetical protein